jgi:hypothetical protein
VLTTGGSRDYRGRGDSDNHITRIYDIYDPATNTFRAAAAPEVGRNYHSEALLLPDGRVVTLGPERTGGQDDSTPGAFEQRIEIYSPPTFTAAPDQCSPRARPCYSAAASPNSPHPIRIPLSPPS